MALYDGEAMGRYDNRTPGGLGKYGPEVIGQEQFEREREQVRTSAWKYGSDVVNEAAPALNEPAPAAEPTWPDEDEKDEKPKAKGKK